MLIAGVAAAVSVFLSALAAYAFSRMRFAGRRVGLLALLLIQGSRSSWRSWRSS
ncbi:hypothetical protein KRMM14A1004_26800 [Krasilnikovia sp. MM14-A1004]